MAIKTFAAEDVTFADENISFIGGSMADRYWVAPGAGVWQDNNNWSTVSGGGSGASYPVAGDNVYFDAGSSFKCTLGADNACATITQTNTAHELDLGIYSLTLTGAASFAGKHTMGNSAGTGFTVNGFTFVGGTSIKTWTTGSIINNSGNYSSAGLSSGTPTTGRYTQTGSGTFATSSSGNSYFYEFTVNSGVTCSALTGSVFITRDTSNITAINGTLALGTSTSYMGARAAGSFTMGVNGDITGSNIINTLILTTTLTNNKVGAISFSGTWTNFAFAVDNMIQPAWNFSNADVILKGHSTTAYTRIISAGNLYAKTLTLTHTSDRAWILDCTANPNVFVSGNMSVIPGAGGLTFNKGTGTWTFTGNNADITFAGKTVTAIVILTTAGQIKTLTGNLVTTTLTVSTGTLACSTYTATGSGAFSIAAGATIRTSNTNGLVHASGSLTGFSGYTWTDGCYVETRETMTADGTTLPSSTNIHYIIDGTSKTVTQSANYLMKSLTIQATAIHSIATFNCTLTGVVTITGTLTGGISADTGFTSVGITQSAGGKLNLQTTTKINNSGALSFTDASSVFTTDATGIYTQTETANYNNLSNYWYSFTLADTKVLTLSTAGNHKFTNTTSGSTTINGTIVTASGRSMLIGGGVGFSFTVGANGDFSGAGNVYFRSDVALTWSNSRVSAFSITGSVGNSTSSSDMSLPAWDFSNADFSIVGGSAGTVNRIFSAGTLKCKAYNITIAAGTGVVLLNSTNNPSFVISGNITLNTDGTLTYTPGSGSITVIGSSANINLSGKSVEAIIIAATTSQTKTYTGTGATVVTLTITGGIFDLQTGTFTSTGATTLSNADSTIKIGTSASTGFSTGGITWNTGSKRDWQNGSVINCAGNWVEPNETISANNYRGTVIMTGSGNLIKENAGNQFYSFTQNVSVTTTLTGSSFITGISSAATIINGTMALQTYTCNVGVSVSAAIFTMGVSSDITGSGMLSFYNLGLGSSTYTNNKASAFSITGTVYNTSSSAATMFIPAWDFSNADIIINGGTGAGSVRQIGSGTLKGKAFSVVPYTATAFTLDNGTYNPSFVFSGNILIDESTAAVTYTKGSGSNTYIGNNSNIALASKAVEAIIINATAGQTKTIIDNFTTDALTITVGILSNVNNKNITVIGAVDFDSTGTATGVYTRGTAGIFTLGGTSGSVNINFRNQAVYDLSVNCGTGIKVLVAHGQANSVVIPVGTLNQDTYNLVVAGNFSVTGTHIMGISSDTGLTAGSITLVTGFTTTWEDLAKINNAGNFTIGNGTRGYGGSITQTGSGNYSMNTSSVGYFYAFTLNVGITLTAVGAVFLTRTISNATIINGVIDTSGNDVYIGTDGAGITFGVSSDITGSGSIQFFCASGNMTNNRASAFSLTGSAVLVSHSTTNLYFPAWNFANADIIIKGGSTGSSTVRYITAGILYGKSLTITHIGDNAFTANMSANPNFVISGAITFTPGVGGLTYIAGSGTTTLTGTTGTHNIDYAGKSVEALVINCAACVKQIVNNFTTASITAASVGHLNIGTYTVTSTGAVTIGGTDVSNKFQITIGISAGEGLKCGSLIQTNAFASINVVTGSTVTNNGNFTATYAQIFATLNKVYFHQTGNGTIEHTSNLFPGSYLLDEGVTITCPGEATLGSITGEGNCTINGIINLSASVSKVMVGAKIGQVLTFGVNSNVTGADGDLLFFLYNTASFVNNRTTAWSFSGLVRITGTGSDSLILPAWDYSNAAVQINARSSSSGIRYIGPGTLKAASFRMLLTDGYVTTLDCSTYNPSFVIAGAFTTNSSGSTGTVTWVKGTGTMTLDGTSGTHTIYINVTGAIEAIILNSGSAIKQISNNFSTAGFTGLAGSLRSSVAGTLRDITLLNAGTSTGCSYKDIRILGQVLNCKDKVNVDAGSPNTNTNLGHCAGYIFFNDVLV